MDNNDRPLHNDVVGTSKRSSTSHGNGLIKVSRDYFQYVSSNYRAGNWLAVLFSIIPCVLPVFLVQEGLIRTIRLIPPLSPNTPTPVPTNEISQIILSNLEKVNITTSVPRPDLLEWISSPGRQYLNIAQGCLDLLQNKSLKNNGAYIDVIFWYYMKDKYGLDVNKAEDSAKVPMNPSIDQNVLREAILKAYNDRNDYYRNNGLSVQSFDEASSVQASVSVQPVQTLQPLVPLNEILVTNNTSNSESSQNILIDLEEENITTSVGRDILLQWIDDPARQYLNVSQECINVLQGRPLKNNGAYIDVIFWYYMKDKYGLDVNKAEDSAKVPVNPSIDQNILRQAILKSYNERNGLNAQDFGEIVQN